MKAQEIGEFCLEILKLYIVIALTHMIQVYMVEKKIPAIRYKINLGENKSFLPL